MKYFYPKKPIRLSAGVLLLYCLTVFADTYTVKRDDTLWDLAHSFLNDPFRWHDIWNVNQHIKDPHWIYPGDALTIPGQYEGSVNDERDLGPAKLSPEEKIAKFFNTDDTDDASEQTDGSTDGESDYYTSEIRSFLSKGRLGPGMQRQAGYLWMKKDEKKKVAPGNAYIEGVDESSIYRQFDRITGTIFGTQTYSVGDTVDIIHSLRFVKFNGEVANLVRRVALGRVEEIRGGEKASMEITLFKVWDVVRHNDRIAPAEHFSHQEIDEIVQAQNSIVGHVFEQVEAGEAALPYKSFILDKGTNSGVQLGDIFLVYNVNKKKSDREPALLGCVVNTSELSSTLLIMQMKKNTLKIGDKAKLFKRITFNSGEQF